MAGNDATFLDAVSPEFNKQILQAKDNIILTAKEMRKLVNLAKGIKFPSQLKTFSEKATANLNKTNKALNTNRDLTKKLVQANQRLADAQSKTGKEIIKVREQTNEVNRVNRTAAKIQLGLIGTYKQLAQRRNKALQALQNELSKQKQNKAAIAKARAEYNALAKKVQVVDQRTRKFTSSLHRQKTAFGSLRATVMSFTGALGLMGGAFLAVQMFQKGTGIIREFGATMSNIAGIFRTTRSELKDLENEIIAVAGASINTATQVGKLAENLATLGKSPEEIKALLKPVNDLSIGLNAASGETGEFLVQTLNAFGAGTEEAAKYADQIATIRTSTSLDFQRMRDSFQYIAPISKLLNKDLAYTGSVIGILSDNSLKAESAGRLLSTAQIKLSQKGKSLADALEEINQAIKDGVKETELLKIAGELFGAQAAKVGIILAQNTDEIEKNAQAIRDNGGALDDLVKEQLTSLDAKYKILTSRIEEYILSTDQASGFSKSLGDILDYLSNNVARIANALFAAIKVFVIYKTTTLAIAAAQKIATIAMTTYKLAVLAFNGQLLKTIRTMRILNAVTKTSGIGLFLAVVGGAYAYFTSFSDGADKATDANERFNESLQRTQERSSEIQKALSGITNARERQQRATELLFKSEDHLREKLKNSGAAMANIDEAAKILSNSYGKTSEEIETMIVRAGNFSEQQKRIIRNNVRDTNLLLEEINKSQRQIDQEGSIKKQQENAKKDEDSKKRRTEATKKYNTVLKKQIELSNELSSKFSEKNTNEALKEQIDLWARIKEKVTLGSESYKFAEQMIDHLQKSKDGLAESAENGLQAFQEYTDGLKEVGENAEKTKEIIESFISSFGQEFISNSGLETSFSILNDSIEGFGKNAKVTFQAIAESAQELFGFIDQFAEVSYQNRSQELEQQRQRELEAAGDNESSKQLIEEKFKRKQDELDAKRAEQKKRLALFNIAINTAQAIVAALPNVPLSITVGIIGAAQAALVASSKIPQFKDGTTDFKGGLAVLGDGGKHEYVTDKNNALIGVSDNKDTLYNLPKHANVYKDKDAWLKSFTSPTIDYSAYAPRENKYATTQTTNITYQGLTEQQLERALNKTLAKQPKYNIDINERGYEKYREVQGARTTYLNNRIRF